MDKKLKIEDIPDGYNYAAVDADGFAYAFKDRPIICDDKHDVPPFNFGHHRYIGKGFDSTDWQNSLVSREAEQKPELKKLTAADIPEGYDYAVINFNGTAFATKGKPIKYNYGWDIVGTLPFVELEGNYDTKDWSKSLVSRETDERYGLKKLTAADIPEGYNYAAVDADGQTYVYIKKPSLAKFTWFNEGGNFKFFSLQFDASDWKNSLVSRETAEQAELKKLTAADIPDGYEYAAVDSNGVAFGFKQKPNICDEYNCWRCDDQKPMYLIGIGFDSTDWQNSLVSLKSQEINKNPLLSVSEFMQVVKEIQDYKNLPIETQPAYKETTNKLSYSEIDPYFLEQMARRMNEGKKKYGPNNWKKLSDINELLDAAQRHLLELRKMMEEDFEPLPGQETDLQHCAALACNAMFIHYHLLLNT